MHVFGTDFGNFPELSAHPEAWAKRLADIEKSMIAEIARRQGTDSAGH